MQETTSFIFQPLVRYSLCLSVFSHKSAPSVEKEAEIMEGPVSGPCLVFQGFRAGWTGDSCSGKGQVASGARVTFESFAGERTTAYLELVNDGTTSLHYDWKVDYIDEDESLIKSSSSLINFPFI